MEGTTAGRGTYEPIYVHLGHFDWEGSPVRIRSALFGLAQQVSGEHCSSDKEVQCGYTGRVMLFANVPLRDVPLDCFKVQVVSVVAMDEMILVNGSRGMSPSNAHKPQV